MATLSPATRFAFREHLAHQGFLNQISSLFNGAGLKPANVPDDQLPSGQRGALVERYYAGIDWTAPDDVRRVLCVYEAILLPLDRSSEAFQSLMKSLEVDGYAYEAEHLVSKQPIDLTALTSLSSPLDRGAIREHLRRIEQSVEKDPAQAIGSAKELVETVAKLILQANRCDPEKYDSVQQLVREALKALDLSIDSVPRAGPWNEAARQILAGLSQIAGGLAELRNRFGTGHGRLDAPNVEPRHARLAVGAAATLVTFMLESVPTNPESDASRSV